MIFLHSYGTTAAHDAVYNGEGYGEPWVAFTRSSGLVTFNHPKIELRASSFLDSSCYCGGAVTEGNVIVSGTWDTGEYAISFERLSFYSDVSDEYSYHVEAPVPDEYAMVDGDLDTSPATGDGDYRLLLTENTYGSTTPPENSVYTSIDGVPVGDITVTGVAHDDWDQMKSRFYIVREDGVIHTERHYGTVEHPR